MIKIVCVVGARPNFMKIAPIMQSFKSHHPDVSVILVHTGQHYDHAMNDAFFQQLNIPVPNVHLDVGSGSHAVQTAEIMRKFEPVLDSVNPNCVLVVGDVNSTIACALVATKKGVPVIHVEAGLRSGDRSMPEEINRILTDQLSERLYLTEKSAHANLIREGIDSSKIVFAGNVMIDTLMSNMPNSIDAYETIDAALASSDLVEMSKRPEIANSIRANYAIVTLHRPSNVDDVDILRGIVDVLCSLQKKINIVFPMHPRTANRIESLNLKSQLHDAGVVLMAPLGYHEMLGLIRSAKVVLTDSGGLQEETTALGVACLTLRENTERPITIEEGTNTLVGNDPNAIARAVDKLLRDGMVSNSVPDGWDGNAAKRITDDIVAWLQGAAQVNVQIAN